PFLLPHSSAPTSALFPYTTLFRSDACDSNPVLACLPPSGSLFLLGATTVHCQATDACGNTASCSFILTIGSIPPSIAAQPQSQTDRKSTRLNSSHLGISYAVFCLK